MLLPVMDGVGVRIGDYELVGELGEGGMAKLYLARLAGSARQVAIKVIHPQIASDPETVKMLRDEARLGLAIRHPNVVHVEAVEEHEGSPYLVMEYVEGVTLATILRARTQRRAPLPAELAVAIVARVADGLHAAHEATDGLGRPLGIVHRDVSPSNVLIDTAGRVKLIDFGVAKARQRLARTLPGSVKGKLAYMAPEQLAGSADRRVDVFALGVVLWEMLALRRLFAAASDVETVLAIREGPPILPPSCFRDDVPHRLDDVVLTMLARDVEERFCTAAAARHALLLACPAARNIADADLAPLAHERVVSASSPLERTKTLPARW